MAYEKIDGLTLSEWIQQETKPRILSLFGDDYPEFTPALCSTKLGDGLQLIYFGTIDQRPYHWLLFIDSKTDITDDDFDIEMILELLEDEFGRNAEKDYESEDDYMKNNFNYPMVDYQGGHYGLIVNFGTGETGLT